MPPSGIATIYTPLNLFRTQLKNAPPLKLPHKQKAHQMMGFLLVKLSIPGGNAVVTSSG